MKYTFYYQDLRFAEEFFTEENDLESDKDAYLQGLDFQNPWGFKRKDFEGKSENDLVKELGKADTNRDSVVVLWIKKGSKKIYEA